jgi:membrane fusion protein (multidrug efflux system)
MKLTRVCNCLALTAAVLALPACGPATPSAPAAGPPQVNVVTVHRTRVPVEVQLPGRTSAYLVAQVRARVDGIVLKREFSEGSEVKAGQRLYEIDPAPFVATLHSAQASLEKARANLASTGALVERYKQLLPVNGVSKQDYDNAVSAQGQAAADVATAKAAVETAQINLGYTDVRSPITGRTGVSAVTQGAYVQASAATLMTTTQQIDPIYVDLTQASIEGLQLRREIADGHLQADGPNQAKVALTLEDGTAYPIQGTLEFSDVTVNPGTGSVTVRAVFPNPNGVLLPGMFVRARIRQGVANDVFLVPEVAVSHDPQGHATAMVVGQDDKVAIRKLDVRGTRDSAWIVDGGLQEGERVIVAGLQKVQPGAKVSALESGPADAGNTPVADASTAK